MAKLIVLCLLLATLALAVSSCSSNEPSGSREYVPGKGWVPTK
jgi:hypothetical protein